MAIPSVIQGLIEAEDGKVFELESSKGSAWLESISSFRFEPNSGSKPYTVRKESGIYWYGCRKIAGKVRKKYIGKSPEISVAKLEEIAEALEIPPVPRANEVSEATQKVTQEVAEVAQDRLTALELQVANLQKAVESLQEVLPGKLDVGDSLELPKVDSEVAEELQNELGNLKAENEKLSADYAALLESSSHVTNKLRQEVRELRSQLETEKTRGEEIWEEMEDSEKALAEVRSENSELEKTCDKLRAQLNAERADREELQKDFDELNKQHLSRVFVAEALGNEKSAATRKLPDAADVLNQLKTRRKKSKVDLGDVEKILEILGDDYEA